MKRLRRKPTRAVGANPFGSITCCGRYRRRYSLPLRCGWELSSPGASAHNLVSVDRSIGREHHRPHWDGNPKSTRCRPVRGWCHLGSTVDTETSAQKPSRDRCDLPSPLAGVLLVFSPTLPLLTYARYFLAEVNRSGTDRLGGTSGGSHARHDPPGGIPLVDHGDGTGQDSAPVPIGDVMPATLVGEHDGVAAQVALDRGCGTGGTVRVRGRGSPVRPGSQ